MCPARLPNGQIQRENLQVLEHHFSSLQLAPLVWACIKVTVLGRPSAHRQLHCQARISRHTVQRPGRKLSDKRILRQVERLLKQQAVQDAPGARQECPQLPYIGGHLPCELVAPNTEEACG